MIHNKKIQKRNNSIMLQTLVFISVLLLLSFQHPLEVDAAMQQRMHASTSLSLQRHQQHHQPTITVNSTLLPELDRAVDKVIKEELMKFNLQANAEWMQAKANWDVEVATRYFLTNHRFVGMMVRVEIKHHQLGVGYLNKRAINFDLFRNKPIDFKEIFTNNYIQVLKQQASSSLLTAQQVDYAIEKQQVVLANEGVVLFVFNEQQPNTSNMVFVPYTQLQTSMRQIIVPSALPIRPAGTYTLGSNREIDLNYPIVALTFDDGPAKGTTKILDVFEKYGVVGTFYVVGSRVYSYPSVMKRIVETGSEVGNHSWSHPFFARLTNEQVFNEIDRTNLAVYNTTGVIPRTFRPPYGSFNNNTLAAYPSITFVMWSLDTSDWSHRNAAITLQRVKNQVKDGDIILMHDLVATTADAIEDMVVYLLSKNFQLVTVSEMIELRNIRSQLVYSGQ